MRTIHRYNSRERHHYMFDRNHRLLISPELLYAGTLYDNPNWMETEHSHKFVEIILLINGEGTVYANDKYYYVKKGDVIIYNEGVRHHETSTEGQPFEAYFMAADKIRLENLPPNVLTSDNMPFIFPTEESFDKIGQLFKEIVDEASERKEFYYDISNDYARIVIMELFRLMSRFCVPPELQKSNPVIDRAKKFIHNNFTADISLSEVAKHCYVSKCYISHLFKDIMSTTVNDYITGLRMEEAKFRLAEENTPVNSIARYVGYDDPNYFCRCFKRIEKMTPSEFRKKYSKTREGHFTFKSDG